MMTPVSKWRVKCAILAEVSEDAKALIRNLLKFSPKERSAPQDVSKVTPRMESAEKNG